jgi:uncharacterized protein (DUF1800 family)
MLTRRECLMGGGAAAAALASAGCSDLLRGPSQPEAPAEWADRTQRLAGGPAEAGIRRSLNRAGYGPRPGDIARVAEIGLDGYLEEQLHPDRLEESRAIDWRLWSLDTLQVDTDARFDLPKEQVQAELQQAAVVRAVYSRRQLQQVMVDFWTDHFNVSQLKGDSAFLKTSDDDEVIRRHALGRFRDLLWASAKSPAMLYYLDNARNTRSAGNENYARELMELHTLGVDGGYTQRDVQEVARCFTGWSLHDGGTWWNGSFVYRPEGHDDAAHHVLGQLIPPHLGERQGERVLDLLSEHPATARFIARKLCRRFIADAGTVPERLVARLAQTFRRTDGDIRQVLSVLLRSEEFRQGTQSKLKRPFDFAISALRALNADTDGRGVVPHLHRMGQAPYQWAMPNGYPDRAQAWLPSLLGRWNFSLALVSGRIEGSRVDLEALVQAAGAKGGVRQAHALQTAILGHTRTEFDGPTLARILTLGGADGLAQTAALLLASPPFQWR